MAPALVEHSAAKERNSISKEYSKIRSCLSQFDIDLLSKLRHQYSANSFETKVGSSLLEMNNSEKEDRQKISFADNKSMVSLKDIPVITLPKLKSISSTCDVKSGYKNGTLNYKLEKVQTNDDSSVVYSSKCDTTKQETNTYEIRPPQPIATMDNSSIANYLQNKKESCGLKFFDLNRSMSKLNSRLRQLQSKNVMSHVSSHVTKLDTFENSKSSKSADVKGKKEISSSTTSELSLQKPWEDLRKVHDMVSCKTDDTDCEDDLEVRHRVPVGRSKKKSDNPPPPPEALHQWKIKRAYIGSQCSWLNLKISTLDQKIAELDDLLEKHKLEKKNSRTDLGVDNYNLTNLDISEEKSEVNVTHAAADEQICRRVLPYSSNQRHKYIKRSLETNNQNYNCRCLPSVGSCRLCLHSLHPSSTDTRDERTGKLDWSFHPTLSYENDVSLSFLLEETLRKQRINTKVTISKPTKKKKKQKIKEGTGNNELSEKDHAGNKHSSTSKISSDKNHVRMKGDRADRLKYEELPRKRSTGLESSGHPGRSRKSRKLSESEESWKPSTPTELTSPYPQSLPSSAFFPLKQRKKNSTGGDYDINNIVIPYSMAAATRVERIQYKEIPTPGWRNIGPTYNGTVEPEECEITDDEAYLDRHSRCEVTEKKKFTDYFQPVIRRRPYHLSESTASGPPSPLINEDFRPNVNTPIDSPIISTSTSNSRVVNVTLVPEEERESCWPCRTYPLNQNECKSLRVSSTPSVSSSTDTLTTTTCSNFDLPKYTSSKYPDTSTNTIVSPSYTPTQTPMPSPLCSPGGTPSDMDVTERSSNPDSWTVKVMSEPKLDVVTTETQSQQRTGIVLKLAKK